MTAPPLASVLDELVSAVTHLSERSDELSALPGFSGPGRAAELVGILDDGVSDVRSLPVSLPGELDAVTDPEVLPAIPVPLCALHRGLALRYRTLAD